MGLAAGARPASAILLRLPNGKEVSYQAMTRNAKLAPGAVSRPRRAEAALSNLDYSGGPVMSSNTNYVVVWSPSNYHGSPFQSDSHPAHGYVFGIDQFFSDLAHDSGGGANSDSVAVQYNGPAGTTAAYNSHFGGEIDTTDPLPISGCPYAPANGACLTDSQIQAELDHVLTTHGLPRDLSHEYFLITPPDLASCFDASGDAGCSGNATQKTAFCAYHSASATSSSFLYANIPDVNDILGCDPFVSSDTCVNVLPCEYNNTYAEGVLSAISHEHIESITDPQPNNAWTDWQVCGQGSPMTCGGEIGDKCNADQDNDPTTNYNFNSTDSAYVPYNMTINGRHYWLQREWSNQSASCLNHLSTVDPPPGSSFIFTPDSHLANTVDFNATGSCGNAACLITRYVWQFNDDVSRGVPTQNITTETTSPTINHRFPHAGMYVVALTTMTADGRSFGSSRQVVAVGATQAAFTFAPSSPTEVNAVSFNASASTHDPSAPITSYSWNFGDGSTGSGVATSHRFSAGNHVVTLRVTDVLGRTSTTARVVAVRRGCHVPKLKGKSLTSARTALVSAGCTLGHVSKPHKKRKHKHLVVGSQTPGSGVFSPGFAVAVKLVYK